jgi:hypothetical protein
MLDWEETGKISEWAGDAKSGMDNAKEKKPEDREGKEPGLVPSEQRETFHKVGGGSREKIV